MLVLGLTTSTRRSGAALVDEELVLGEAWHDQESSHAERLFALIDEALLSAGRDRTAIDAVACDVGPGSFTGVRLALAAAKSIAFGLARPLLGVSSLAAMAAAASAARPQARALAAVLDARRGETFLAVYAPSGALIEAPAHLPHAAARAGLACRAASDEFAVVGEHASHLGLIGVDGVGCDLPAASWVARLAWRALRSGAWAPEASVDPLYLRPPDAVPMAPRVTAARR